MRLMTIVFIAMVALTACKKETETITETVMVDGSQPVGAFTAMSSGTLVEQNDTGTMGTVQLGKDSENTQFIRFSSNFNSTFATGTLIVYLSTSMNYVADPGNGNPDLKLVGPITQAGESYLKISPEAGDQFDHVILWCASAGVPFGYAALN
ncbi:MAG: hypothetical protein RL226_2181 [Bacteroidota bacterium]